MRKLFASLLLLGSTMPAAADTYVYVSRAPEQSIRVYRLDAKDGALAEVQTLDVTGAPGCLSIDPQQKFLFASLRTDGLLASYRIDPASGKLTHLSTVSLGKNANAAFVAPDHSGRFLVSSSYMAGKVVVHAIAADGKIQEPALQTITTAPTAHCNVFSPDNRWMFVPHVTPNAVYQFRFDAKTGKLEDAGKAAGGAKGAGPRHLAFHPSGKFAFTSNESGSSITSYAFHAEKGLEPLATLTTLPADFKGENTTAEVKVHPSGKWVWVSNRGHDSLAGFRIDAVTAKLEVIGQTPTEKTPRSFSIDPDGQFVFGAGEGSGKLAVFRINPDTGLLTRIHTYDVGRSLTWVLPVKQK